MKPEEGTSERGLSDCGDRDYQFLSEIVRSQSGIHLGPHKRVLLRARLTRRLRALSLASFSDYCRYLREQDPDGVELVHLLDAISTNVTEFFREPGHFDYLRDVFFPKWKREPSIRILSAGCSTGEEPYSIAMVARETLEDQASRVEISGIDISMRALASARAGVYQMSRLGTMPVERLRSSFQKGTGSNEGLVRVIPSLQAMVRFQRANLVEPLPFTQSFHAVFCRNVAIYFERATQREVFSRFCRSLVPGGTLFVGHSESMLSWNQNFRYVRPTIYERPGRDEAGSVG